MKKLNFLFVILFSALFFSSCEKNDDFKNENNKQEIDFSGTYAQLLEDYSDYVIYDLEWSTSGLDHIANFYIVEAKSGSTGTKTTAWYSYQNSNDGKWILEMETRNVGLTVPEIIKEAFEKTTYSNTSLWVVVDIDYEYKYSFGVQKTYYEVELQNVADRSLEAELIFDATTGEFLYSKEEYDNDYSNDKVLVTNDLRLVIEAAYPGAVIIECEYEYEKEFGYHYEVDLIVNGMHVEVLVSTDLQILSTQTEYKVTYALLDEKFNVVKDWFLVNSSTAPAPGDNVIVEVTEGKDYDDDYRIEYYYEISIDDYYVLGREYEVEFYLDVNFEIVGVEVNDRLIK